MPMTERDMLTQYGEAVFSGNAALFVGAGLSMGAGYPSWNSLLEDVRTKVRVPEDFSDLPLLAQYFVQTEPGGRSVLNNLILGRLNEVETKSSVGHKLLEQLDIDDIWTTNYDCLIEDSIPQARVITSDGDLLLRNVPQRRRVTKMHGSLSSGGPARWLTPPVITRSDYERYELTYPRLWATLKATYLTKSMLFLGFSFTDPNIEILLKLSRSLQKSEYAEHFTVLRRPDDPAERRLHDLRVVDLENSNIGVCEVDNFEQLNEFLSRLVRRTKKKKIFVSGGAPDSGDVTEVAKLLGSRLAEFELGIISLAGKAAMIVSYEFGRERRMTGRYDPFSIELFFRQKSGEAPALKERVGTAIYTNYDQADLRRHVIDQSRSMVVIGGADGTMDEIELALGMGVPVIPLAHTGGAARAAWSGRTMPELLSLDDDSTVRQDDWKLLNDLDPRVAVSAAVRLIRQTMYLSGPT
ncbi:MULTISPECIES: SIR2 family protein [unclassified Amycolatopsis]|uniref:SIR2 family protein n=1 Tax=unclassified Amycolatopsis TaxID=2618356 RepID=UPI002876BF41|nr:MULTISPECIES: SIR2 family protein [unclassified Amycolatopsis]MDS0133604.1 SIR2 family protein [Amycolatopsis sp. 505]MDS0148551.1 SIR2 family protein [Amycolatopsis sp. CM201R]